PDIRAVLELEAGGARGHAQPGYRRQRVDQLLGQAVAEVLLAAAAVEVEEGQHGHARPGRRHGIGDARRGVWSGQRSLERPRGAGAPAALLLEAATHEVA